MADELLYLLDTSAILAFSDGEEGAKEVEQILRKATAGQVRVLASSISLMELYYVALRGLGEDEAGKLIGLIKSWPLSWMGLPERLLLQAGKLKARYQMSVADAIIAATAKLNGAILVHKDQELESLSREVKLIKI
jgi:predicted nucleic acid-binding protein